MEPDAGLDANSWAEGSFVLWAQSTSEFDLCFSWGSGLISKKRMQTAHHASHFASLRILASLLRSFLGFLLERLAIVFCPPSLDMLFR